VAIISPTAVASAARYANSLLRRAKPQVPGCKTNQLASLPARGQRDLSGLCNLSLDVKCVNSVDLPLSYLPAQNVLDNPVLTQQL
jgi:hypothetical protein